MRNGERGDGRTRLASPATRSWSQRFSLAVLVLVSVVLMLLGKADAVIVDRVRSVLQDIVTPVVELAGMPARLISETSEDFTRLTELREENAMLRTENAALRQADLAAETLRAENALLRQLLKFAPEPMVGFATARVVADQGGSFVRNLLLNAGEGQGVQRSHVVVGGHGLVGRVVEVGRWSARVLLITDLNSRVPVLVENSRWRAVLAGDNSDSPRLLYLSESAKVAVGERIVTSGHGGVFPPGLPVGEIESISGGSVRVRPYEDFDRVEFVKVVNFGLEAFDRQLENQSAPVAPDETGAGRSAPAASAPTAAAPAATNDDTVETGVAVGRSGAAAPAEPVKAPQRRPVHHTGAAARPPAEAAARSAQTTPPATPPAPTPAQATDTAPQASAGPSAPASR